MKNDWKVEKTTTAPSIHYLILYLSWYSSIIFYLFLKQIDNYNRVKKFDLENEKRERKFSNYDPSNRVRKEKIFHAGKNTFLKEPQRWNEIFLEIVGKFLKNFFFLRQQERNSNRAMRTKGYLRGMR